jgi:DNA repair exonuclease SbcCD nuclease subunit
MIAFIADIHLKLNQKNVPTTWAINRYNMLFEQINNIKCDRLIVGGDIFDKLPSMEELSLYFKFVKGLKVPTIFYSGNHEMQKKTQSFLSYLKEPTTSINPLVTIIDELYEEENFYIVSYELIHKKGLWESLDKSKAVFTHVRGAIEPHVKPEIDLNLIKDFPIVIAGDLHSHSNTQGNLTYPGSPLTTSFHRTLTDTGYILIDEDDLTKWSWAPFELPQLIRKTVAAQKDIIATDFHHTIYELEGNTSELGLVDSQELLEKKLVKRNTEDVTLVLNKEMTIPEELIEYLTYILELPENTITGVMTQFYDSIAKT